jgi:hypothetical protein
MATENNALPIISDHTEETIHTALRMLHGALATYGNAFPSFEDMLTESTQRERITNRANRALSALSTHRREAAVAKFRSGVAEVVSPYVADAVTARAAFLTLPAEVRRFMPSFPSTVSVPVSEVAHIFGEGTPETHIVKALHTLGYKVSKKDNTYHIVAELSSK